MSQKSREKNILQTSTPSGSNPWLFPTSSTGSRVECQTPLVSVRECQRERGSGQNPPPGTNDAKPAAIKNCNCFGTFLSTNLSNCNCFWMFLSTNLTVGAVPEPPRQDAARLEIVRASNLPRLTWKFKRFQKNSTNKTSRNNQNLIVFSTCFVF